MISILSKYAPKSASQTLYFTPADLPGVLASEVQVEVQYLYYPGTPDIFDVAEGIGASATSPSIDVEAVILVPEGRDPISLSWLNPIFQAVLSHANMVRLLENHSTDEEG